MIIIPQTAKYLGVLLLSFLFTGGLAIPFINLLYQLKFRAPKVKSKDFFGRRTVFNRLHGHKVGTPVGGGILVIVSAFLFSYFFYAVTAFQLNWTSNILFITLFSFGLLGLYDDLQKFFNIERTGVFGLRIRHKFMLQLLLALGIGWLLYSQMGFDSVYVPILRSELYLGGGYIVYAAIVIVATCNAFNITDGLDGLAGGLLMIALVAFWHLATLCPYSGDIILFIAVMLGGLLAFLYFNIKPARFFMGDSGALAFGAMLAVVSLLVRRSLALPIIGGVFVVEASSSLVQWGSMLYCSGKKIFKIAPLHHHFEALGWEETKVTMRFWLAGAVLAFAGLLFALL